MFERCLALFRRENGYVNVPRYGMVACTYETGQVIACWVLSPSSNRLKEPTYTYTFLEHSGWRTPKKLHPQQRKGCVCWRSSLWFSTGSADIYLVDVCWWWHVLLIISVYIINVQADSGIVTIFKDPKNFNVKHPLEHEWVLYFDGGSQYNRQHNLKEWKDMLQKVYTIATVEDFWGVFNNVTAPRELYCWVVVNCKLFFSVCTFLGCWWRCDTGCVYLDWFDFGNVSELLWMGSKSDWCQLWAGVSLEQWSVLLRMSLHRLCGVFLQASGS